MPSDRVHRQQVILSLIREKPIRNQSELLRQLAEAGLRMTQSTLSRELKALGIAKAPDGRGGYRYVAGAASEGPLSPLLGFVTSVERGKSLIVVKTPPGNAQGVARGIDEADWDEIMGTIAGDDTILIICRSEAQAEAAEERLRTLIPR